MHFNEVKVKVAKLTINNKIIACKVLPQHTYFINILPMGNLAEKYYVTVWINNKNERLAKVCSSNKKIFTL